MISIRDQIVILKMAGRDLSWRQGRETAYSIVELGGRNEKLLKIVKFQTAYIEDSRKKSIDSIAEFNIESQSKLIK